MVAGEMQDAPPEPGACSLQGQGIGLEDYLQITGRDPESFADELREAALEAVKVDLALRAVAEAEGLDVTDDELEEEIATLIGGRPTSPSRTRPSSCGAAVSSRRYARTSRSARRSSGWSPRAEVVDEDGNAVPEPSSSHRREHDHDHDHDRRGHDGDDEPATTITMTEPPSGRPSVETA